MFSTHLLPLARGNSLHALRLARASGDEAAEIEALYRQFLCRASPWCGCGRREGCRNCSMWRTRISAISGLRWIRKGERLVVVSCLDNLGKGAAGQAVQNMNGMLGFQEAAGLQ